MTDNDTPLGETGLLTERARAVVVICILYGLWWGEVR